MCSAIAEASVSVPCTPRLAILFSMEHLPKLSFLLFELRPPSLLQDLSRARITLFHVAQSLKLPLIFKEQPFLCSELVKFITLCRGTLEDCIMSLTVPLSHDSLPSLLHMVPDTVLLIYPLIFSHQINCKWAPLQLPGPPFVSFTLRGQEILTMVLPFTAHVIFYCVTLGEPDTHDFCGFFASLGTHFQPFQQPLSFLRCCFGWQQVRNTELRALRLIIDEMLGAAVRQLAAEEAFLLV